VLPRSPQSMSSHQGSIVATSTAGQATQTTAYGPYGETASASQPLGTTPFGYTARERDTETLYYYRARYYSTAQQRFISQDPIGLAGGINTYAYVGGDPVSWTDPDGLCPCGAVVDLLQLARGDKRDWSQAADRKDVNKAFGEGTYKCNLFADEQYETAGYNLPNVGGMFWNKGKYPPGAGQLSDSSFKLSGWPIIDGSAQPGDLVAHGGHVGIATSSRATISASPSGKVENNWGFRKGQEGVVIRRCSCGE
jgi:RHS repeat-associated protein